MANGDEASLKHTYGWHPVTKQILVGAHIPIYPANTHIHRPTHQRTRVCVCVCRAVRSPGRSQPRYARRYAALVSTNPHTTTPTQSDRWMDGWICVCVCVCAYGAGVPVGGGTSVEECAFFYHEFHTGTCYLQTRAAAQKYIRPHHTRRHRDVHRRDLCAHAGTRLYCLRFCHGPKRETHSGRRNAHVHTHRHIVIDRWMDVCMCVSLCSRHERVTASDRRVSFQASTHTHTHKTHTSRHTHLHTMHLCAGAFSFPPDFPCMCVCVFGIFLTAFCGLCLSRVFHRSVGHSIILVHI